MFLLGKYLSLLINELSLISRSQWLNSLRNILKSSHATKRLLSSMCSFTEVDKAPLNCLLVQGDTHWCSKTLTSMYLKVLPVYKAWQLPHVK